MGKAQYKKIVKWHDFLGNDIETLVETESAHETITLKLDGETIFHLDDSLAVHIYTELKKVIEFSYHPLPEGEL